MHPETAGRQSKLHVARGVGASAGREEAAGRRGGRTYYCTRTLSTRRIACTHSIRVAWLAGLALGFRLIHRARAHHPRPPRHLFSPPPMLPSLFTNPVKSAVKPTPNPFPTVDPFLLAYCSTYLSVFIASDWCAVRSAPFVLAGSRLGGGLRCMSGCVRCRRARACVSVTAPVTALHCTGSGMPLDVTVPLHRHSSTCHRMPPATSTSRALSASLHLHLLCAASWLPVIHGLSVSSGPCPVPPLRSSAHCSVCHRVNRMLSITREEKKNLNTS